VGSDIVALVKHLAIENRGVIIIGNSMAAAAAVWYVIFHFPLLILRVAAELPKLVQGIVLLGPFVRDIPINFFKTMLLKVMLGGFWGPGAWSSYYKTLYKANPPEDLQDYASNLLKNLKEPKRFNSVYSSIFASKGTLEIVFRIFI
jgi:pimeloyl-ACP methyl ester carboxylesterase